MYCTFKPQAKILLFKVTSYHVLVTSGVSTSIGRFRFTVGVYPEKASPGRWGAAFPALPYLVLSRSLGSRVVVPVLPQVLLSTALVFLTKHVARRRWPGLLFPDSVDMRYQCLSPAVMFDMDCSLQS